MNQNFIATFLCVNRDVPASKCRGKCYLNKKIKENKEQENEAPKQNTEKKTTNVFLDIYEKSPSYKGFDKNNKVFFFSPNIHSFLYLKEIFHPPQLS